MAIPELVMYDLESVSTLNRYQNVRTSILNMLIFNFFIIKFDVLLLSDWFDFWNMDSYYNKVQW